MNPSVPGMSSVTKRSPMECLGHLETNTRPRLCPIRGVVLRLNRRNRQDSGTPLIQSREAGKDAPKLLYASSRGPAADLGPAGQPVIPDVNDLAIVGRVFFCLSNCCCHRHENNPRQKAISHRHSGSPFRHPRPRSETPNVSFRAKPRNLRRSKGDTSVPAGRNVGLPTALRYVNNPDRPIFVLPPHSPCRRKPVSKVGSGAGCARHVQQRIARPHLSHLEPPTAAGISDYPENRPSNTPVGAGLRPALAASEDCFRLTASVAGCCQ